METLELLHHHPIHLLFSTRNGNQGIHSLTQSLCGNDEGLRMGSIGINQASRHVVQLDGNLTNLRKADIDSVLGRIGKDFNKLSRPFDKLRDLDTPSPR